MWDIKKLLATIGLALVVGTVLAQDRNRWEPDGFGGYNIYDSSGNRIGRADNDCNSDYGTYDTNGNRTGRGEIDPDGSGFVYDNNGNRTGTLDPD